MRIRMTVRGALDFVLEQVAFKSGMLLTDHDVRGLPKKSPMNPWAPFCEMPPDSLHGVRPEILEDFVRVLRAAIGNLPDATPGEIIGIRSRRDLAKRGIDVAAIVKVFGRVVESGVYSEIGRDAVEEIARSSKQPLDAVVEFMLGIVAQQERSLDLFNARSLDWDGVLPLAKLFDGESIPQDSEMYLDQRFIDYLAAQGEQVSSMHWRNFERLTAEYFRRAGYEVVLGKGSKDGGVDIRVFPKGGSAGPPLLLIQCKRYQKGKIVELEYVKALWSDVQFENARGGVIATTARVSPDGKRVAAARGYPLSFVEHEVVKGWSRTMWRHSFSGEGAITTGVGRYLLPPIVPR